MEPEQTTEQTTELFDVLDALDICLQGAKEMENVREKEDKKVGKTKRGKR